MKIIPTPGLASTPVSYWCFQATEMMASGWEEFSVKDGQTMLIVPSQALNFELEPQRLGFNRIEDRGFISLTIVFADQRDTRLLEYLETLQQAIREHFSATGIALLDRPEQGEGLFVYPKETLHCTMAYDPELGNIPLPSLLERDLSTHPFRHLSLAGLTPFPVHPRWLWGAESISPNSSGHDTRDEKKEINSFSLQLFIPTSVEQWLSRQVKRGRKIRASGVPELSRGVINLARFISPNPRPLPPDLFQTTCEIFRKLNTQFPDRSDHVIDKLSVAISDAWLSNPDAIQSTYQL